MLGFGLGHLVHLGLSALPELFGRHDAVNAGHARTRGRSVVRFWLRRCFGMWVLKKLVKVFGFGSGD